MNTLNLLLVAIIELANQYSAYLANKRYNEIDALEDQIDSLAANGSSASKLRIERLAKRLQRKLKQFPTV